MKMLILSLSVLLVGFSSYADSQTDCRVRFAVVGQSHHGTEYTSLADLNNRSLDLDIGTTYRFEVNYRLNPSKPWSPQPKVTGGKTSVIASAYSSEANVYANPSEGPQVLYITPTAFTSAGRITLSARTGGIPSQGTIDEPSGNASCNNVEIYFRTYFKERVRVILYSDVGFGGRQAWLTSSESISNLRFSSIGNDDISSIKIPRGCSVTLYRDKNYGGQTLTLSATINDLWIPDLNYYSFGDRASSIVTNCQ